MTMASTPKGERRRQALVEAAAQLLIEKGFDGVSHRAVAQRAELPLASTTYYFESLDGLVAAAVEHHSRLELARARAMLDQLVPGRRDEDAMVELVMELLLGPVTEDDAEAVLLRYERLVTMSRRPYLRPLMRQLGAELRELLMRIAQRSGYEFDERRLEHLISLVDGAVVNALIEVSPDPRGAARRMLVEALRG
jgi:DNA-binding transcriptional regulator YbjK